jgi:hypothetical protein
MSMHAFPGPGERRGIEFPEVIDLMTEDASSGEVELVMFEPRPWAGGEIQLFELQEKLNAYLSFALDGEMAEAYPALVGRPLRVVLRSAEAPSPDAVELLVKVRHQLALQEIDFEVRYARESPDGGCGAGCGCAK